MKPGLFKNELLATSDPLHAWIFEGLWCLSDREGRLEDRPRRIHLEINAGRAFEGTEQALVWLTEHGFIKRYTVEGIAYIQVLAFHRHQKPHLREAPSTIPPPEAQPRHDPGTTQAMPSPASSLTPHSLTPLSSSLRSEHAQERVNGRTRGTRVPEPFPISADMRAWAAEKCPHVANVDGATEEFVDYWRGVSGRYAVKVDWEGTWRNRMRELEARAGRVNGSKPAQPQRTWRPPPDEDAEHA